MNLVKSVSKTLVVTAVAAATLFSVSSQAEQKFDPILERKLVKICEAIRDDDRGALRKAVRNIHVSYRDLEKGLVCNGDDMMTFAAKHNSQIVGQYIARRTGVSESTFTAKR